VAARPLSASLSGIAVTYTDPFSSCNQFGAAHTTFYIFCDPSVSTAGGVVVTLATPAADCSLQYTIRTSLACPSQSAHARTAARLGAGWIVLILFIVGAAAYLVGGIAYKRWKHGARGVEAIPNIWLWRKIGSCLTCSRQAGAFDYAQANSGAEEYYRVEDGHGSTAH
jgi:hypothetical protein